MTRSPRNPLFLLLVLMAEMFRPQAAYAYIGPGGIISGIGALLAIFAAMVAAVFGFLWFPLKRLYRHIFGREEKGGAAGPPGPGS